VEGEDVLIRGCCELYMWLGQRKGRLARVATAPEDCATLSVCSQASSYHLLPLISSLRLGCALPDSLPNLIHCT
jgi:hypothetical protein